MIIIIQARSTSKRFPGKIFEKVGDITIIERVYNSCLMSGILTVFAIPETDEKLKKFLKDKNWPYFEGDEENVLSRYYNCASAYRQDWVFRVTADCPLLDTSYIVVLQNLVNYGCDYYYTDGIDGQDVELFSKKALDITFRNAKEKEDLEHVTSWMRKSDSIKKMVYKIPFKHEKLSVDTPEDLERVRKYANSNSNN